MSNLEDGDSVASESFTIRGAAIDDSGLRSTDSVEYGYWDAALATPDWSPWITVSSPGQSWYQIVSGLTEGTGNIIRFRATDKLGNVTALTPITYGYDKFNPTLVITDKATINNSVTKSGFTLSGTANDANGIGKVEVSLDGGATFSDLGVTPTTDGTIVNWSTPIVVAPAGADVALSPSRSGRRTNTERFRTTA